MKKKLFGIFTVLFLMTGPTLAHAYSYSFDFKSGKFILDVTSYCSSLSITTLNDIVVDVGFDLSPKNGPAVYSATVNMNLGILGMFNYPLVMNDISLGTFQFLNPSVFLGDGTVAVNHQGSSQVSGEFGGYQLTDATLQYDITIRPDQAVADRYGIAIRTFFLHGGNTSELLTGLINDLNETGQIPVALSAPFTIPMTVSGALDLKAEPVPVPAAVLLFGSGLLGLIGYRRRQS